MNLSGHKELWVAVEWHEMQPGPGVYYAWLDTFTGPHIPQKGDFYYLNNAWGEIYTDGPDFDGNWGIGAIIEYGCSELSIGNITGPRGIKANVSNTGEYMASNVQWSILVTGGLPKRVKESSMGNMMTLNSATSILINLSPFWDLVRLVLSLKQRQ